MLAPVAAAMLQPIALKAHRPHPMLYDLSLAPKHWVSDLGIVRLFTERVQTEPAFKQQLFALLECSKTVDPDRKMNQAVRQAAANAITLLVKAGVQLNGMDFNQIQVPGADLSYGMFDHTQFKGADLIPIPISLSRDLTGLP